MKREMTDKDWQNKLTKKQYEVLRKKSTEEPFSGELLYNKQDGTYLCAGCGNELFEGKHKFDSGSGWPSFYNVKNSKNIRLIEDLSHGMRRVEVICAACEGHLGHVFYDAPTQPTGMRFCINSCALDFKRTTKDG